MLWNLLDYPAGVVPITSVRGDDLYPSDDAPRDYFDARAASVYNAQRMTGLPVGVQVPTNEPKRSFGVPLCLLASGLCSL
jgi:fatty acid amide hydrolase